MQYLFYLYFLLLFLQPFYDPSIFFCDARTEDNLKRLIEIPINLLRDKSGSIRLAAIHRLLSFSLSLHTDSYLENFKKQLSGSKKMNRMIASIAVLFVAGRVDPSVIESTRQELFLTKDPLVRNITSFYAN